MPKPVISIRQQEAVSYRRPENCSGSATVQRNWEVQRWHTHCKNALNNDDAAENLLQIYQELTIDTIRENYKKSPSTSHCFLSKTFSMTLNLKLVTIIIKIQKTLNDILTKKKMKIAFFQKLQLVLLPLILKMIFHFIIWKFSTNKTLLTRTQMKNSHSLGMINKKHWRFLPVFVIWRIFLSKQFHATYFGSRSKMRYLRKVKVNYV